MASNKCIIAGIKSGSIVPYIGPGALKDVTNINDNSPIPADSESLILAMNNGRPMAPRLMYEFPRAAMHLENRKGRKFIEKFLCDVYKDSAWSGSKIHQTLLDLCPPYIVDCNRDMQFQTLYKSTPHTLIVGAARLAAHPYRFDIYEHNGSEYTEIDQSNINKALPILFKPLGTPSPKPSFVASDADFVDYITELMGGFAIPDPIKEYRKQKQYVFIGIRFSRDTERMIMSDIIYSASDDHAGWAFIKEPTAKEIKFLTKKNIEIIEKDWSEVSSEINTTEVEVA